MTLEEMKELRESDDETKLAVAIANSAGNLTVKQIDKWLDACIKQEEAENAE